ncbi:tRNA (adenosine(37)-N6)-threonylcarbamoyltransferase complex ATPase subunit type 1 TsaE [Salisaeta longa]|uniref:tRNA (adenosine(37)-N6)-threonylcarbamoyltransferase complex ATPase subunit type 1 TsaE n=1 Tax=Salisaeta longa TaxID=503170 RepID=UPI0003B2E53B|nr:tRNA (adenosine(37)-N6)-threonylcarbamoyltransferase complex ATPase subunit type 1 TsaE [Salisaeta longa]
MAASVRRLFPYTSHSLADTRALAHRLAEALPPGTVLALSGDLGTGKTHLVKGLAEALGIDPTTVRSPTFTIVHSYTEGTRPLHHFDAYRMGTPAAFEELGFASYLDGDGLCVIEWPERVASLLPPDAVWLSLSHEGPSTRRFEWGRKTSDD